MRIGLDCSSACTANGSGVSHYILSLLRALVAAAPTDQYVACWRYSRWRDRDALTQALQGSVPMQGWQGPIVPSRAAKLDLFHGLDARVPRWSRVPRVVTVHDVFPAVCPEFSSERFNRRKLEQTRHAIENAAAVLCMSRATADDLERHLDAPSDRLVVVPAGAGPEYQPSAALSVDGLREAYPIPEHYLLAVGQLTRRKNVARMIEAFSLAAPRMPSELHFVLAGTSGDECEAVEAAIADSPVGSRIVRLGYVAEGWKPALYAAASGLAYVTHYEGFGLPVVEAMASGCPVLTGSRGAAPEVGGEAVLAVDPTDREAIAEAMITLMRDSDWRQRAVAAGLDRAKQFTWARTALATRFLYHRVLSGEPVQG